MNHITIPTAAGQPATMSSREIAEITGKRHDNVMMDCRKLRDFYAETYSPEKAGEHINHGMYSDSTGRSLPLFILSKDAALDLVTGYSLPHRHAVNQRWKELEAKQKAAAPVVALPDFTNPAESARAWALEYEEKTKAQHALALAAPKVAFVDNYVSAETGSLGLRQVCKLLSAKQNEFTAFLIARNVMYRTTPKSPLQPRAEHMHIGRFEAKTGVAEHEESAHAFVQYKFTAKGVEWIAGEWAKHNVRKEIQ